MKVRAKFRCIEIAQLEGSSRRFKFQAVYDTSTPENERFALATPWGELMMMVTNPAVEFELGKNYFLDMTLEAPAPTA